jgi:hypothetical protein
MKRIQLIEWGIVTVGLICGYKLLEGLFAVLLRILYDVAPGMGSDLIRMVIYYLAYAISFILLIRKSAPIAQWLNGPLANDTISIKINKRSLLQVILMSICAITFISNIATIAVYLFEQFKNEAGRFREPVDTFANNYRFKIAALQSIVAFVILYFSKDISGWFIRKNDAEELTFESEPENDK